MDDEDGRFGERLTQLCLVSETPQATPSRYPCLSVIALSSSLSRQDLQTHSRASPATSAPFLLTGVSLTGF
jgi:hypothetical protein